MQTLRNHIFCIIAQFQVVFGIALKRHGQNSVCVCIGFGHNRQRVNIQGQLPYRLRNFIAYIIRSRLHIHINIKLDRNQTRPLIAVGRNGFYTSDTIQTFFQRFRNLTFYHIGVCASVICTNRHYGRVNVRIFANTKVFVANKSKNDD